jgi:DNA-binding ferritin-like protein (Dps family)
MWIEKLVGDLGDKKSYREYKARVKRLPTAYREAGTALERYLMYLGPSDDGKALIAMLSDLAELLEQSVADGVSIRDLVGDDPSEFAETFMANYAGGSWVRKERARLARSIEEAIDQAIDREGER